MNCPICGSDRTKKKGQRNGHQRYQCRDCGRKFQGLEYKPEDVAFPKVIHLGASVGILSQIDKAIFEGAGVREERRLAAWGEDERD